MNQEEDLAILYLDALGTKEAEEYGTPLADLYVRMKHGDYVFKSDQAKRIAGQAFEEREKAKAKVRGLKKTVMSELRAIPGGPDASAAIARLTGVPPGGRRTAIRKRKARKTRKSRK